MERRGTVQKDAPILFHHEGFEMHLKSHTGQYADTIRLDGDDGNEPVPRATRIRYGIFLSLD
jgi:hypothetical protein